LLILAIGTAEKKRKKKLAFGNELWQEKHYLKFALRKRSIYFMFMFGFRPLLFIFDRRGGGVKFFYKNRQIQA